MSREYEELVKKRVSELEKKLPKISPRKLEEEIKVVYGKVSDEFFKPENWIWVAGFFYGDGYVGYIEREKGRYYPLVAISQHKKHIRGLEEVGRLWYARPHWHGKEIFEVRKTGKVVVNTILPTILSKIYTPKKEEAEFIIEHGSPVTIEIKNKYMRTFPHAKSRKAVIKGSQEVWLDMIIMPTPLMEASETPAVIYLDEESVKELEYVKKE